MNPKIAGKWMFIPLKNVSIGIDPYPHRFHRPTQTQNVLSFSGRCSLCQVVASQTWLDIGHQAASRFGDLVFDASSHVLLGVGQAPNRGLKVGQTVKLTAVINRPELNGKIGRITKVNGAEVDVALPRGLERFSAAAIVLQDEDIFSSFLICFHISAFRLVQISSDGMLCPSLSFC